MLSEQALKTALQAVNQEIAERRQTDATHSPNDTDRLVAAREEICNELQP